MAEQSEVTLPVRGRPPTPQFPIQGTGLQAAVHLTLTTPDGVYLDKGLFNRGSISATAVSKHMPRVREIVRLSRSEALLYPAMRPRTHRLAKDLDDMQDWMGVPCKTQVQVVSENEAIRLLNTKDTTLSTTDTDNNLGLSSAGEAAAVPPAPTNPPVVNPRPNSRSVTPARSARVMTPQPARPPSRRPRSRASHHSIDRGNRGNLLIQTATDTESEAEMARPKSRDGSVYGGRHRAHPSNRPPTLAKFSGDSAETGTVHFEKWLWELDYLYSHDLYTEEAVHQAVVTSLRGDAARAVMSLPSGSSIVTMVKKLRRIYGTVTPKAVLEAKFHGASQYANEKVIVFAQRLETYLNEIHTNYPEPSDERGEEELSDEYAQRLKNQRDQRVRGKFFTGLIPSVKNAIRHRFDGHDCYDNLLIAAREVEAENNMAANSHNRSYNRSEKYTPRAQVRSGQMVGDPSGQPRGPEPETDSGEESECAQAKAANTGRSFQKRQNLPGNGVQCYNCKGYGHIAKECPTPREPRESLNGSQQEESQKEPTRLLKRESRDRAPKTQPESSSSKSCVVRDSSPEATPAQE